jgi:hypothetical protein
VTAALRRLAVACLAVWALAACANVQVDPPRKDPALYGMPPWTP